MINSLSILHLILISMYSIPSLSLTPSLSFICCRYLDSLNWISWWQNKKKRGVFKSNVRLPVFDPEFLFRYKFYLLNTNPSLSNYNDGFSKTKHVSVDSRSTFWRRCRGGNALWFLFAFCNLQIIYLTFLLSYCNCRYSFETGKSGRSE